jgi:hypothetical protein
MRSKIVFSLPFIDYRNMINAHSHFAFSGWVGLSILTLFVYCLLPAEYANKKIYLWLLALIEVSSLGMAFSFPFVGYAGISTFFSTLYIITTYVFAPVFVRDFLKSKQSKTVQLLSIGAIASLLISALGPLGISYILISESSNSILYRDSIYTFLHFQYNGFFTLSIFALIFNALKDVLPTEKGSIYWFAFYLTISVVPSLFLSLLWHNSTVFYILAGVACVLILISLMYLTKFFKLILQKSIFTYELGRKLLLLSILSFILKMLLNIGTIHPELGNAIYGNRPVIIGFLHLVFLAFVSFYLLSAFIESKIFSAGIKLISAPILIFVTGVIFNEALLMFQGLEILFYSNSKLYNWLLWGASIILFIGASAIAIARLTVWQKQKKALKENASLL